MRDPWAPFYRPTGLLVLLAGSYGVNYYILDSLEQVHQGAEHLNFTVRWAIFSILGVLVGLAQLLTGSALTEAIEAGGAAKFIVTLVLVVPALVLGYWLQSHLESLGYRF